MRDDGEAGHGARLTLMRKKRAFLPLTKGGYGTLTIWFTPSSASTVGVAVLFAHVAMLALNCAV